MVLRILGDSQQRRPNVYTNHNYCITFTVAVCKALCTVQQNIWQWKIDELIFQMFYGGEKLTNVLHDRYSVYHSISCNDVIF